MSDDDMDTEYLATLQGAAAGDSAPQEETTIQSAPASPVRTEEALEGIQVPGVGGGGADHLRVHAQLSRGGACVLHAQVNVRRPTNGDIGRYHPDGLNAPHQRAPRVLSEHSMIGNSTRI